MSVNETDDLKELRLWLVRLVVGFIALVGLVGLPFLWWLNVTPLQQVEGTLEVKDVFDLKNQAIKSVIEAIKIIATVFGGIAILFNVYYGAKRAKALEKNAIAATQNAIAATKNADVAEQGQITERFTKAIEQLGSDNISIRLGGIYALERIAKDSERDHWTIMEVLSAFVRENAPLKEDLEAKKAEGEQQPQKLRTDIQAALTVIGRRDTEKDPENQRFNLSNTDLRGADLREANLQGANFYQANLQGTILIEAQLQGADLGKVNLQQANLIEANLQGTILTEAQLQEAFLNRTNLQQADLMGANLQGAQLSSAKLQRAVLKSANLQSTRLCDAQLQGADIWRSDFSGASLMDANLEGAYIELADFRNAHQLTQGQIDSARGQARLPDYLKN